MSSTTQRRSRRPVAGLALVLLAGLVIWVERHVGVPPLGLAIGLTALAVIGGAVAPRRS